jgi:hypothetical protein
MIRASLKEAINRTLDTHHYLGHVDFVIREYEKDNESCLAVGYRKRRGCSFVFQLKADPLRQPYWAITMSPGHEALEESLTVNDRLALLQELKNWQQRVHEDLGCMPQRRLFEAHIRGIRRMEARLGLASPDLVAGRGDDDGFLEELRRWDLALQEFVNASQNIHESLLLTVFKARLQEVEKIGEYLAVFSAEFSDHAFSLRRELDQIKREATSQIERSMALKEKLEDGTLCLLENDAYQAVIDQFTAHSTRVEEIRRRLGLMPDAPAPSLDRAARLFDELQSLHKRSRGAPEFLNKYRGDETLKKLKRHLAEAETFRQGTNTLDIREVLEEMRNEISAMQASDAFEHEKFWGTMGANFRSGLDQERKGRHAAIQFLDENIRKIDKTARRYLDDLTNPDFPEKERGWRASALISLEQKKRTFAMAIRLLKEDEVRVANFVRGLTQPDTRI